MSTDDLIAALEQAVAAEPGSVPLRRHLAEQLLRAGQAGRALDHLAPVLEARPDDVDALRLAATAAAATGDPRAASFRRLADALDPTPDAGPGGQGAPGGGEEPQGRTRPADPDVDPAGLGHPAGTGPFPATPLPSDGPTPESVDDLLDLWEQRAAPIEPEIGELLEPDITLTDVGGMEDVKRRLDRSLLGPMRNPTLSQAYGKAIGGGLLLWGPPGCGKTYLARACAGELGASFYSISLSDVLDLWIGASERNLTAVFEVARSHSPCVLFFDEVDALGQKRSHLRHNAGLRGVVNQFLVELDGVGKKNDGVYILGASNHPWDIDPALLRPGRFDRMMIVLPPDAAARQAILETHLRDRPTERLDLAKVAANTDGLTGADLALICDSATELAIDRSLSSGSVEPITMKDLKAAVSESRTSIEPWFETARNYATYSNQSGQFDELLAYLRRRRR
ncbi:MAG: AAA family ATPase [Acidimicrobiales bacterium]